MFIKKLVILLLNTVLCFGSIEESNLRTHLFQNYNNKIRPVINESEPLLIKMGLAVQNLEEFNQMEESLKLNIWLRSNWNDEYLDWDSSISNISFLSVSDDVWLHDIELMNAAGKPDLYLLNGGENLYSTGNIMWSKPAIFKFSCSLELELFPFDKQTCRMKFGSWLYSNRYLMLRPYDNIESQIDILSSFSHSEWKYIESSLEVAQETRDCCPGEFFDIITYEFVFKRYPHYYKLSMGMTISLVVASFIIMLMEPDNVSRTGTAVFIPLTILALQLTIADKIPVVGYETLMDKFFICCFVSSMIVSIESGIIFSIITTNSKNIRYLLGKVFNIDILREKDSNTKLEDNTKLDDNTKLEDNTNSEPEEDNTNSEPEEDNTNSEHEQGSNTSFDETIKVVETSLIDDSNITITNLNDGLCNTSIKSNDTSIISQDVIKTIDYNDDLLKFTYTEKLLMDELKRIMRKIDNYFRILLPLIFFIYIIVIYSYEEDI